MVVSKPEKMVSITINHNHDLQLHHKPENEQNPVIEEIQGLIKLHKNGYVQRSINLTSCTSVSPFLPPNLQVNARDIYIDKVNNIWARTYVPKCNSNDHKLPIMVYFHGGGFCVGSTSWKCYHNFLGNVSSQANCVIISVNYRLAPENRLPAAYEDGMKALMWVTQQAIEGKSSEFWAKYCDFSRVFIGGDSAGGNIAYNLGLEITGNNSDIIKPLVVNSIIMIQPFFGGKERTNSELQMGKSLLNLEVSDKYWRMALPLGADRDDPWCNPLKEGRKLEKMRVLMCVGENDILRDKHMELCSFLGENGDNNVECLVCEGVGHAFHVLDESPIAQDRKKEMVSRTVEFINK